MKLLTYDIIEAELAKRGCSQKQIEDDPSGFTEKVLNHYEARVDDRWADQDLYVYEESTRDGYSGPSTWSGIDSSSMLPFLLNSLGAANGAVAVC